MLLVIAALTVLLFGGIVWGDSAMASSVACSSLSGGYPAITCSGTVVGSAVSYVALNYWNGDGSNYYEGSDHPDSSYACPSGYTGQSLCVTVGSDGTWTYNGHSLWSSSALPPGITACNPGAPPVDWTQTWTVDSVELDSSGMQGISDEVSLGPFDPVPCPETSSSTSADDSQRQMSWLIGIVTFGITLPIWRSIFRG